MPPIAFPTLNFAALAPELAARVRTVDPYAGSLEQTRARLIQLCDEALAEEARA